MPFLWLEVNDVPSSKSDRAYLERNCIALLSNFAKEVIDPPSSGWLGLHSSEETIRQSGRGTRTTWARNTFRDSWMCSKDTLAEQNDRDTGLAPHPCSQTKKPPRIERHEEKR